MKKNVCTKIATLCAVVCVLSVDTYATGDYNLGEQEEFYSVASEVVEAYYKNRDINENIDVSNLVTQEVWEVLNTKIELMQMQKEILEHEFLNYQLEVLPIYTDQWEVTNEVAHLYVQAKSEWFYSELDDKTTISEIQMVTVCKNDDDTYTVVECYDYGDNLFLGPIDSVFKTINIANVNDGLQDAVEKYKIDFEYQLKTKKTSIDNAKTLRKDLESETKSRTLSYPNRTKISNWARNNFDEDNPSSGNPNVVAVYKDFHTINNSWDCTNFVSHALLAGGAVMHDDGGSGLVSDYNQWYYRSVNNRCITWSGVKPFYNFLTRNNPSASNYGPYATEEPMHANMVGDVVQAGYNNDFTHSMIVTKSQVDPKVTGRSGAGIYNDNVFASSVYGNQRLLHLYLFYEP